MEKIYVLKKQKLMYGPYTMLTIKSKGLRHNDLVWYEGLEDWTPAEEVKELADCLKAKKVVSLNSGKKNLIEKIFSFLN